MYGIKIEYNKKNEPVKISMETVLKNIEYAPVLNFKNFMFYDFNLLPPDMLLRSIDIRDKNIKRPGKGKICLQIDNEQFFIRLPLTFGNKKLPSNVGITSLLPIVTCPAGFGCFGKCYAVKSLHYPSCWNRRLIYTFLAYAAIDEYFKLMEYAIKTAPKKTDTIRIHESGDFFSKAYITKWNSLVKLFPNLVFYYYTKTNILNLSEFNSNSNVVANLSVYKGFLNFGGADYINNLEEKFKNDPMINFFRCPCKPGESEKICNGKGKKACNLCKKRIENKFNFCAIHEH